MKQRTILSLPVQAATPVVTTADADMTKLDIAIFEFMSDFKKRSVNDIMQGMCMMGYQGRVVDKRMKTLFARKWFDRNGERGGEVKYVLKKSIKHPGKETVMVKKESQIDPFSKSGLTQQWDNVMEAMGQDVTNDPTAPNDTQVGDLSPAEQLVSEGAPVKPVYTVLKTDHPRVAVWKVMQDGDAYTIQDLSVLLDQYAKHKVAGAVVALVADGTLVGAKLPGTKAHAYRVQPDAPMPVLQARKNKDTPQPEEKEPTMNTTVIHPSMQSVDVMHNTFDTKIDTANGNVLRDIGDKLTQIAGDETQPMLLDITINLRGQQISLAQAHAIRNELTSLGFVRDDRVGLNPILSKNYKEVSFTVKIAGQDFTPAEAQALATELSKL